MKRSLRRLVGGMLLLTGCAATLSAADSAVAPRPVPLTRPEMKRFLEDMKQRKPRIPLPELTDEDRQKLGDRADSYESRLRYHYLPASEGQGGGRGGGGFGRGREADSDMTLDYAFKTQLFWIVSRTNNCQYCLGHQESKLLGAGMTEDEIAALDGDWSDLKPSLQAAYAYARKLTYEPHLLREADFVALRKHYDDKQILEMTLSIAGNNSINRWKEGAGIPQSAGGGNFGPRRPDGAAPAEPPAPANAAHSYLTPTSEKYAGRITKVAPFAGAADAERTQAPTTYARPPLESPETAARELAATHSRKPRLPLADEAKTRELLHESFPDGKLPQWARLLATFPNSAKGRVAGILAAESRGDLSPLLKAQVAWIIARQDRAWYAAALAQRRLKELDAADDMTARLDGAWDDFSPAERALFLVARKLAATPVVLTDADVDDAVKLVGARDVVQLISYTTHRASFDRLTETAALRCDE